MAEAEIIKDSPDSPEPPNKKPLVEMDETPPVEKSKGRVGTVVTTVFVKKFSNLVFLQCHLILLHI